MDIEQKERPAHWRQIDAALAEMPEAGEILYDLFEDLHDDGQSVAWQLVANPTDKRVIIHGAIITPGVDMDVFTRMHVVTTEASLDSDEKQEWSATGIRWGILDRRAADKAVMLAAKGEVRPIWYTWTPSKLYVITRVSTRGFHDAVVTFTVRRPTGHFFNRHTIAEERMRRPLPILFKAKNQFVFKQTAHVLKTSLKIEG